MSFSHHSPPHLERITVLKGGVPLQGGGFWNIPLHLNISRLLQGPSRGELWRQVTPGKVQRLLGCNPPSPEELWAKGAEGKDTCSSWETFPPSPALVQGTGPWELQGVTAVPLTWRQWTSRLQLWEFSGLLYS